VIFSTSFKFEFHKAVPIILREEVPLRKQIDSYVTIAESYVNVKSLPGTFLLGFNFSIKRIPILIIAN
jgi:hypothetical protein